MTFTDEDLRRLKKLNDYVPPDKGASAIEWRAELWEIRLKLAALLARLEAAEQVIIDIAYPDHGFFNEMGFRKQHYEAWRKVTGK